MKFPHDAIRYNLACARYDVHDIHAKALTKHNGICLKPSPEYKVITIPGLLPISLGGGGSAFGNLSEVSASAVPSSSSPLPTSASAVDADDGRGAEADAASNEKLSSF